MTTNGFRTDSAFAALLDEIRARNASDDNPEMDDNCQSCRALPVVSRRLHANWVITAKKALKLTASSLGPLDEWDVDAKQWAMEALCTLCAVMLEDCQPDYDRDDQVNVDVIAHNVAAILRKLRRERHADEEPSPEGSHARGESRP